MTDTDDTPPHMRMADAVRRDIVYGHLPPGTLITPPTLPPDGGAPDTSPATNANRRATLWSASHHFVGER